MKRITQILVLIVLFLSSHIIHADSYLNKKAPDYYFGEWISEEPEIEGRYVLIGFWWIKCPGCRNAIYLMNSLHKRYGNELDVIGIAGNKKEDVEKFASPKIEFYSAVDQREVMRKKMGVDSVPYIIILDPKGYVRWEGYPFAADHKLRDTDVLSIIKGKHDLSIDEDEEGTDSKDGGKPKSIDDIRKQFDSKYKVNR